MSVFVYAGVGKGPAAPKKATTAPSQHASPSRCWPWPAKPRVQAGITGGYGIQPARQPIWMLALVSQAEAAVLAEGADCKSRPKA